MVLETTYSSKEQKEIINQQVGKPFSFIEAVKLKGIGSKRMIIDKVSLNMNEYINKGVNFSYGNIELRPNGILLYINKGLKTFTWVIPFYHLVIFNINGTSIHAHGKFVHFRNNKTHKENKIFFNRLLSLKVSFDRQYDFQL